MSIRITTEYTVIPLGPASNDVSLAEAIKHLTSQLSPNSLANLDSIRLEKCSEDEIVILLPIMNGGARRTTYGYGGGNDRALQELYMLYMVAWTYAKAWHTDYPRVFAPVMNQLQLV